MGDGLVEGRHLAGGGRGEEAARGDAEPGAEASEGGEVRLSAGFDPGERAEADARFGGGLPARKTDGRTDQAPATADLRALATRLKTAPPASPQPDPYNGIPFDSDTEEIIAGYARQLSLTDVRQLAHAVSEGQPVTIEYVAASGSRTIRTLSELDFDPPYLHAWCHLRNDERVFTLSRIHGVLPG
ncbi:WYL domain-containing protein [Streptomyces sp. 378]|uniref:WYL domain-containing protein n=1 Tax=Streptomyces sp. 378 TaxID=3049412 RepID=UPI0024C25EBE|nr:WYL domain-containing protein [Streptomyces sp. 378]MDK1348285.1 WYL domain-containing protein [Streptomyces sp. 378]